MGKTTKPLTVLIYDQALYDAPEVEACLRQKGHEVCHYFDSVTPDVIIGPRCWRIDPALGQLEAQLKMMIEGVRRVKYPKGGI